MLKWIIPALLTTSFALSGVSADAQCRNFAKKKCRPIVESEAFQFNGQMNSAVLFPGDNADVMFTFYSGKDYRLLVCTQEILGDVNFKLKDTSGNTFYDSKGKSKNYFDFNVPSTQQLILSIEVPKSDSRIGMEADGCVSILVGHK